MHLSYKIQKKIVIIFFLLLPLSLLLLFSYYPVWNLFSWSFTDWNGISPSMNFVGFENYKEIFTDSDIFLVFTHNFAYFIGGIVQVTVALYFAVILNSKIRGKNFFRSVLFMPYILNMVAVAYMFAFVYSRSGVLNSMLGFFGLGPVSWLGHKVLVNYSLAAVSSWHFFGINMIIFLGGLQSIPYEIYEAAEIDGANKWESFKHITLPSIRTLIELNMFLVLKGALNAFRLPFVVTKGGPAGASDTFVTKTIELAFEYQNYGLASAMAVVLLIIVLFATYLQRKLLK